MSRIIYTKKGQEIIVDDENYEKLNKYTWYVIKGGSTYYAARNGPMVKGKHSTIRAHRSIMGAKQGECVDHINHNGLDNRKENLRICTNAENQHNSKLSKANTSGYKGVSWNERGQKFQAQIRVNCKAIALGYHELPEDAARAYDRAAIKHFGEFAQTNKELL